MLFFSLAFKFSRPDFTLFPTVDFLSEIQPKSRSYALSYILTCFPSFLQVLEKQIDAVTVPIYPTNSASVKGNKDGSIKERRLAAGE